jgi:hypothetical protein
MDGRPSESGETPNPPPKEVVGPFFAWSYLPGWTAEVYEAASARLRKSSLERMLLT